MEHTDFTPHYPVRPNSPNELGLLHTALTEIGFAFDTTSALKAVLRLISHETGAAVAQGWLPDRDNKVLTRDAVWINQYSKGWDDFIHISSLMKIEPRQELVGHVWATKRPAWVPDVSRDQHFRRSPQAEIAGLKTAFVIPIVAGVEVVAVLEFFLNERRTEDDQLIVFLATVASQLGWTLLHKREHDALKASEERYRVLVENAPICIHEIDQQRRLSAVNPAGLRMLGGVQEQDFRGLSALQVVSTADQERIVKLLDDAFAGKVCEFEFVTSDITTEARTFLSTFMPLRDRDGVIRKVIGTSQDITSHKKAEEQLRQSQKMEALGRLAGGIAHDFNNILNVIIGHAYILQSDCGPEQIKQGATEIRKAADRATSLTKQMLAFSRSHVQVPEPRDLNGIIVGMSDMLRRLIGEHIDLQIELTDGVPYVVADAGQIEQIIMNLVVNSRDAMPHGGRLTIITRSVTLEGEEAHSLRLTSGRYALLTVHDNGHGMDSTTQARAFEPFFTTKEPGKGTGIGLATVYGIVKQSGGHVSVQSDVGAGTTLTIHLPESGEHAAKLEPGIVARSTASASGTILLVEDEESVRKLTKQLLQTEGYKMLEAANGLEALECISVHVGQIDLMITDMVMPGMQGRELAGRVRRLRPGIKVLYISGYADANPTVNDRSKVLEKPFTPDELSETVRMILSVRQEPEESKVSILESLSEGECA